MNHPPFSEDAEKSLLGSLMDGVSEKSLWDEVSLIINEDDFYLPSHKTIFKTIKFLHQSNNAVDIVTVSSRLKKTKELEQAGGNAYLAELVQQVISSHNSVQYAGLIKEKSLLRQVIQFSKKTIEKASSETSSDIQSFIDDVERGIFTLAQKQQSSGFVKVEDLVDEAIQKLEKMSAGEGRVTGIPTGFTELDELTSGLHPGEITIIAARPSMGKTALSLNLALHAALHAKRHIAFFSVEMPKETLILRLLSLLSKTSLSNLRVGQLNNKEWRSVLDASAKLSECSLFINDSTGISPYEILSQARQMKSKKALDLIIVDYLQMMSLRQKTESREREVSEISRTLKSISKELKVPIVALAQLNRGVEARSDRRPLLSDLRESGSIEQDADTIIFMYRDDYYNKEDSELKGVTELIIGKQRNGPTDTVKLKWVPACGLFEDYIDTPQSIPVPDSPFPLSDSSGGLDNFAPET